MATRTRRLPTPLALALALLLACCCRGAHALFKATPRPTVAADAATASATADGDEPQKYVALPKPQESDELLIGWMGETYKGGGGGGGGNEAADGAAAAATMHKRGRSAAIAKHAAASATAGSQPPRRGVPRVLSWSPRVMHFPGFLTEEECDEIVRRATPRLKRSGVVDGATGASKVDDVRSSSGQFFARGEFDVVRRVEERIALWTHLPVEFGEGMQVLRYAETQEYRPHADYFTHPKADENGGNRMATVLMYLTSPEAGGETLFPRVKPSAAQLADPSFSACAQKGLSVKATKGDAVLFWSIRPDGRFDPGSRHGGCPVEAGVKFAATKWIHVGPFAEGFHKHVPVSRLLQGPAPPPVPTWCRDANPLCPGWAEEGECLANPTWMVGSREHPGQCIRACARCDVAAHLHVGEKQPPSWCSDAAAKCPEWGEQGECSKNAVWMVGTKEAPGHCLRSCNACELVAHLYKDKVAEEEEAERRAAAAAAAGAAATPRGDGRTDGA